jgi:hypothetical protein
MEFGLYTFADVGPEIDPARRLHNLLEEIELADQLGLDVFGVGETIAPTTPSRRRLWRWRPPQPARGTFA